MILKLENENKNLRDADIKRLNIQNKIMMKENPSYPKQEFSRQKMMDLEKLIDPFRKVDLLDLEYVGDIINDMRRKLKEESKLHVPLTKFLKKPKQIEAPRKPEYTIDKTEADYAQERYKNMKNIDYAEDKEGFLHQLKQQRKFEAPIKREKRNKIHIIILDENIGADYSK